MCTPTCVYAPTCMHMNTRMQTHVPTHMHMGTYVNLPWCTYTHGHTCLFIPVWVHAHIHACAHTCAYLQSGIHTHMHTHRFLYCGHSMLGSGTVVLHLARRFRSPSPADGRCCMCEQLCGSFVAAARLYTIVQTVCKQFPGPADSPLSVSTKLTS